MADYTPAAASASGDAYAGRIMTDPEVLSSYATTVLSAKYRGQEWDNEILGLLARQVSSAAYCQAYTCGAGDAVGDPVRISGNNTVTKALATTEANSKAIGIIRHKGALGVASDPSALTCYIAHYAVVTGLSGGTAGNAVYLSDTGTFAAAAGTVTRVMGTWLSTTEALINIDVSNPLAFGTAAGTICQGNDSRLSNARTPAGTALTTGKIWIGVAGVAAEGTLTGAFANMVLNPSFETVLPGTHTAAIQDFAASGVTRNTEALGWKFATAAGTSNPAGDVKTSTFYASPTGSARSIGLGSGGIDEDEPVDIYQEWSAAEFLSNLVYGVRGRVLNFAIDYLCTSNSNPTDKPLAFITTDGTGGTTTTAVCTAIDNSTFVRVLVTASVPTDCTTIKFGVRFREDASVGKYYLDNAMVVASDVALTSLPYEARPPVGVKSSDVNSGYNLVYTTPPDTNGHVTGDGTADTDWDVNASRPAWANYVIVEIACSGDTPNSTFEMAYYGAAAYQHKAYVIVNAVGNSLDAEVGVGQDGQIIYKVSNANTDGYVTALRWVGDNL